MGGFQLLCGLRAWSGIAVWGLREEGMAFTKQCVLGAALAFAVAAVCSAQGQTSPAALPAAASVPPPTPAATVSPAPITVGSTASVALPTAEPLAPLIDFKESEIKFSLQSLMDTLRDSQHEGWVLAAYPDPNTHRPLIGAGFSLDVPATDHPQIDLLNPHPFLEPSSAQLWQAAGLDPALLQQILSRFDRDMDAWTTRQYRRRIRMHALTPELTEEEATRLLRISAIQAIYNAKAYCRYFDQLSGPQQMALSQLVFQMGVNLEEFEQFLTTINTGPVLRDASLTSSAEADPEYWKTVQATLMNSQWARRYSERASTVIAMFDPNYLDDPREAERRVDAVLRPPARHRRRHQSAHMVRTSSSKRRGGKSAAGHTSAARKRRTT